MAKLAEAGAGTKPNMSWLRLTPPQERVLLLAWTAKSAIFGGHDLGIAQRLVRRELLKFMQPLDGGLRGEFELTEVARAYPPTGLKALIVRHPGRRSFANASKEGRDDV